MMKSALMINTKVFLFLKNYSGLGVDRYFLLEQDELIEVDTQTIADQTCYLICHDYWLIANSIFKEVGYLPCKIIDLDEFQVIISGEKSERKARDLKDFTRRLNLENIDIELNKAYMSIFNRCSNFDKEIYQKFAVFLKYYWEVLRVSAIEKDELHRFINIEVPVSNIMYETMAKGLLIDKKRLLEFKKEIDHNFFMSLKSFSSKYNVPLEVPHDNDVIEYLEPQGVDCENFDISYILRFVPLNNNYAPDLLELYKLNHTRAILNGITQSQERIYPIVDIFGSITSRIYLKDPSIQNISKKYRSLLKPSQGKKFIYIDYDQYEVGIMAALSKDQELINLYAESDMYEVIAEELFSEEGKRKDAKKLFLSYSYGMKTKSLIDAACGLGADRTKAKSLFRKFTQFEAWKKNIQETFFTDKKIGTVLGNYLRITHENQTLTEQEKRVAVSQVVQGTASLIFKKTLIEVSKIPFAQIILPMHDAILLEVPIDFDENQVINVFQNTFSEHFNNEIVGKASLDNFFISM
ncbi:DNA polymerase [Acinetobacter baumannii]|nr:DNA polymerase [Acinetobacter baumannii]MDV7657165.1 DNA polymerase [Acinetobacter baumannii]